MDYCSVGYSTFYGCTKVSNVFVPRDAAQQGEWVGLGLKETLKETVLQGEWVVFAIDDGVKERTQRGEWAGFAVLMVELGGLQRLNIEDIALRDNVLKNITQSRGYSNIMLWSTLGNKTSNHFCRK